MSSALLLSLTAAVPALAADHWAFQPLVRPPVPELSPRQFPGRNPIDAFIAAKLAEQNATLLPEADRRSLLRRLSFDLRGIPPTPEEVAEFLGDSPVDGYENLVDRLLASQQYGERWGRHWLDIAAYADSNGYFSADSDRPLAWKYRDYVVRSINGDKPFDRFIREQIAGDELIGYVDGDDITAEMVDPLIATHFWRNAPDGSGESDGNPLEVKVDRYSVLEGNVQLLGSAFLGLTLQCTRCHDHKFEPIQQEEYYALQAILRPAFDPAHWINPNERAIAIGTRAAREENERELREHERALKTLKESLDGLTAPFRKQVLEENLATLDEPSRKAIQQALDTKEKERNDAMKALLKTNAARVEITGAALELRFAEFAAAAKPLKDAIKQRESSAPRPLEKIAVLTERTHQPPVHRLLVRGNHAQEGKDVGPGIPAILSANCEIKSAATAVSSSGEPSAGVEGNSRPHISEDSQPVRTSGRRRALARWLTSPQNPVVARSLVNRIWSYHFGQGLVATRDNLGQSGARPTHPELLDWLASEFIQSGWRLKHLHRLIVTSATYRQSAASLGSPKVSAKSEAPNLRTSDSHNALSASADLLYAGFPMLRLDAESIRDAMLSVSGEIDLAVGGAYVPTKTESSGQIVIDEQNAGAKRRSLYLQQRRTHPVNLIGTFDGPAHNPVCVQRVHSTVALQSLSLLNSDFIRARARAFAKRVLRTIESGPAQSEIAAAVARESRALQFAFELAYSRPATNDELTAAHDFLRSQATHYADKPNVTENVWTDFCQMLLASNQFLYVE